MAKYYSAEVADEVTREAVQIHGGYGYIVEYPVERYYRDAKLASKTAIAETISSGQVSHTSSDAAPAMTGRTSALAK